MEYVGDDAWAAERLVDVWGIKDIPDNTNPVGVFEKKYKPSGTPTGFI